MVQKKAAMLEKPQTTNHKLLTAFIFAGKSKSIEEDKSRGCELFEHEAFVVWSEETSDFK
jgi:hypothetical protein